MNTASVEGAVNVKLNAPFASVVTVAVLSTRPSCVFICMLTSFPSKPPHDCSPHLNVFSADATGYPGHTGDAATGVLPIFFPHMLWQPPCGSGVLWANIAAPTCAPMRPAVLRADSEVIPVFGLHVIIGQLLPSICLTV